MMGPTKLSTIRERVRKSFKQSDAELLAWFNEQLDAFGQKRPVNPTEIDTLRSLRDALVKEVKRAKPKRKARRVTSRGKV